MLHLVDKKAHYTEKVMEQLSYILQRMHNMSIADFDNAMRNLHNYQIKLYALEKEEQIHISRKATDCLS